ncbi:MAG: non-homologous end joining protein Ku [Acidimicrobiales bacterium]
MARTVWSGSLSFGLVNIPVDLYTATEDRTIHFNQFQSGTSDRIRYKRVNERTGEEVSFDEIVKGHDLGGGEYVLVNGEELEAIAPGRSRSVEITDFVDLDAIDPIYYQKAYYVAPKGEGAQRAYGLLRKALQTAKKAAVATLVMRGKQYLVSVRPDEHVLVLETMYFADEVRDPARELPAFDTDLDFSDRELASAAMLVDSMSGAWDPQQYRDTYRDQVMDLIERKQRGEEVVFQELPGEPTTVADLASVLEASLDAARGRAERSEEGAPRSVPRSPASSKKGAGTAKKKASATSGRPTGTSRRKAS